jgi:hypothetical protein
MSASVSPVIHEFQGFLAASAPIEDLVRMKRAAGRPKDLLALEELGALREELSGR